MSRPPFLVLAACLLGCSDQATIARDTVTRDSAGVTILETAVAAWGDDSPWSVDTVPFLAIGQEDGEDRYLFGRVSGAVRRLDGSIVVGDFFERQLRLFDAQGRFVSAHGRRGPGPGEFSSLNRIATCGADEIWIDSSSRISVWGLDLEFRREFAAADTPMWPLTCFDGHGLLVMQDRNFQDEPPFNTIYTDSLQLMVVDSLGQSRHDLFIIPLWSRVAVRDGRSVMGFVHPLAPTTVLRGSGQHLVVGRSAQLQLDEYALDGRLVRSSRGPAEDFAFTGAVRDAYRSAPLTGTDSMWRRLLEIAGDPMPEQIPAFSDLVIDSEGNAWVRRFVVPGSSEHRWGIFDRTGAFLGHVALPEDLEVFEIGEDYVLGRAPDSLGVEQVRLHRLKR